MNGLQIAMLNDLIRKYETLIFLAECEENNAREIGDIVKAAKYLCDRAEYQVVLSQLRPIKSAGEI